MLRVERREAEVAQFGADVDAGEGGVVADGLVFGGGDCAGVFQQLRVRHLRPGDFARVCRLHSIPQLPVERLTPLALGRVLHFDGVQHPQPLCKRHVIFAEQSLRAQRADVRRRETVMAFVLQHMGEAEVAYVFQTARSPAPQHGRHPFGECRSNDEFHRLLRAHFAAVRKASGGGDGKFVASGPEARLDRDCEFKHLRRFRSRNRRNARSNDGIGE